MKEKREAVAASIKRMELRKQHRPADEVLRDTVSIEMEAVVREMQVEIENLESDVVQIETELARLRQEKVDAEQNITDKRVAVLIIKKHLQ